MLGDRYRLEQRIASGAMGDVWRGIDQVLGRPVAIKILRHDLSDQPGFLDRFRREARLAAMLSHPGIATVFDYGEQDGRAYLVMELVDGDDLAVLLADEGPMRADRAVDLLIQTADALAAAHAAGIVHRDIKPANLMITKAGKVKITDFGISRLVDSAALTATGDVLGTPQYMAPEHLRDQPATPASDVYAAGVVAYEMVSGRPPFPRDSKIATAMAQLHELPPPLPDRVPPALVQLIGRMLAKDPQLRPADGASLADQLHALPDRTMSTAAAPQLAPTLASTRTPTEVFVAASAADHSPLLGPLHRHRRKRLASMIAAAAAVAALAVVVVASRTHTSDNGGADVTSAATVFDAPIATAVTTPGVATVAATAPPPVTTATVTVDAAQYVGRDRRAVIDELRALGLVVDERAADEDSDAKKNTVVAVEPTGVMPVGATVVVFVAGRGKPGKNP